MGHAGTPSTFPGRAHSIGCRGARPPWLQPNLVEHLAHTNLLSDALEIEGTQLAEREGRGATPPRCSVTDSSRTGPVWPPYAKSVRKPWKCRRWALAARAVAMPAALASELFDLLAQRRVEAVGGGWGAVPDPVFPSETGGPIHYANLERSWIRLRRRAQGRGVLPLKLHSTRHTYASLALASGKSVRWVADQLGHSTPMLTLRTYAHAMREEEADLAFTDIRGTTGDGLSDAERRADGAKRLYPARLRRGKRKQKRARSKQPRALRNPGARDGNRTRDIHVGKSTGGQEVTRACVPWSARACEVRHRAATVPSFRRYPSPAIYAARADGGQPQAARLPPAPLPRGLDAADGLALAAGAPKVPRGSLHGRLTECSSYQAKGQRRA